MSKKKIPDSVFDIAFTKRDEEITALEFQRRDIEEDLEEAIDEFVKISKLKSLKKKKKRLSPLLREAKNPDKY
jgi:translation initiation factor 2 beta subunit (eIF-2beta)/eIF-5